MVELPSKFRLARLASNCSNEFKQKLGAVIFNGKTPVAIGYNHIKSHPLLANENTFFTFHAECHAISNLSKKFKDKQLHIYIYREHNKTSLPMLSKPCNWCMSQILLAKSVGKIFYTTNLYPYYNIIVL